MAGQVGRVAPGSVVKDDGRSLPAAMARVLRIVATIVMAAVFGGGSPAAEEPAAEAVARVGGETITRRQFDGALQRGDVAAAPEGPQRQQAEAAVLEQLVNEALLRQAVAREGVAADPAAVDAQVERMRSDLAKRGVAFADFLARSARDEAALRDQIALELALKQFAERRVTPQAVEAHFEKNRRELDGSLVRVSHVVLRPDLGRGEQALAECIDRARVIRSRILEGEIKFAEAARAHSAGPSRRLDGDLGFIPRRGVAHEEFARQAFALAKGDVSQPFATPSGVHILRVTDTQPGQLRLARVRRQLEQALAAQLIRDTLAEGRRTTAIEYAEGVPHFDPETPPDAGVPRRVIAGGLDPAAR